MASLAAEAARMDVDADHALESLHQLQKELPEALQERANVIAQQYEASLWHQLTISLLDFIREPQAAPFLITLFNSFIRHFWKKLNRLSLANIALVVANQFPSPQDAIVFLQELVDEMRNSRTILLQPQESVESTVLLQSAIANSYLHLDTYPEVESLLRKSEKALDDLTGVDPRVAAAYYKVAAGYHQKKADYGEYYKTALLYLGCIKDLENDLGIEECRRRAYDLSLATLLRESMTNFGELLMHPILDFLKGTSQNWLRELLLAFNSGNIGQFEALSAEFQKEPLLLNSMAFLRQKLCLMALVEIVFSRHAEDRTLTFQEIATQVRIPLAEVEHLIMKALSLDLIRGSIDEVERVVNVTWVQPRVLNREQISGMKDRLMEWGNRVKDVARELEANGVELFAAA